MKLRFVDGDFALMTAVSETSQMFTQSGILYKTNIQCNISWCQQK